MSDAEEQEYEEQPEEEEAAEEEEEGEALDSAGLELDAGPGGWPPRSRSRWLSEVTAAASLPEADFGGPQGPDLQDDSPPAPVTRPRNPPQARSFKPRRALALSGGQEGK
ncbi:hypothetical protein J1605_005921 [Eschrichtius robustus]|uniref:Uncharacterized protein n=1 Tax=Eschrichtius robustus TaxID=9764 RepID=A0AB34H801_ESCRO|nr:hypothetical protein J1605_005921 [Eschrichtius robustus]